MASHRRGAGVRAAAAVPLTAALMLAGCGAPSPSPAPTPAALDAAEAELVALLADYRAGEGLRPLVRDAALDDVAVTWSRRLSALGAPSHNPAYATEIPAGWTASGENVGWADPTLHPLAGLPAALHQGWLDSPTHRANLDNPAFTAVGVGAAYGDDGIFVTADFAAYP